ncbi:MAG: STAS domain-containing protein [Nitrospirae bacterium]|nr:STAS domain-containing protein [Nitrospirota bacterium]
MLNLTYNETGEDIGVLSLMGELVIANADEIKNGLLLALGDTKQLKLNISDVTEVDLSCIQILCAAHRFATKLKGHLSFAVEPPEVFKDVVRATGVARHKGCVHDVNNSCLWLRDWA